MPVDDRWSKLSMRDRADLIKIYTKHGVTDLNEIRRHYNSFQDPVFEDRPKPKADLYNRLVDEKDNRSIKIGDGIGTHLMSWATVDDKPVGYSQIQPDNNGNLKDYGDRALDSAIERGDTIQFRDEKDADWWTSNNYKQFYKKMTPAYDEYRREKLKEKYPFYNTEVMNVKANDGHLFAYGSPDHDPNNPYHYHTPEGEKVVITPEEWEANKGKPYFKEVEDAVNAEREAHPGPEYEIDQNYVNRLNRDYGSRIGSTNGVYNFRGYASQLPEGYTISDKGVIYDNEGNAYVQDWFTHRDYPYDVNSPITFTFNKGKGSERNEKFYPVKLKTTIKKPLQVDRTLPVEETKERLINEYIKNNSRKQKLYNVPWFEINSEPYVYMYGNKNALVAPIEDAVSAKNNWYAFDIFGDKGVDPINIDNAEQYSSSHYINEDEIMKALSNAPKHSAVEDRDVILKPSFWEAGFKSIKPTREEALQNILISPYANGGQLGHITPYGQWQYPHQVTTIPSNNITMQGVDYPVVGVSNTGDTKYMLPNMDYLFDGQYVTEYPVNKYQNGGQINALKQAAMNLQTNSMTNQEFADSLYTKPQQAINFYTTNRFPTVLNRAITNKSVKPLLTSGAPVFYNQVWDKDGNRDKIVGFWDYLHSAKTKEVSKPLTNTQMAALFGNIYQESQFENIKQKNGPADSMLQMEPARQQQYNTWIKQNGYADGDKTKLLYISYLLQNPEKNDLMTPYDTFQKLTPEQQKSDDYKTARKLAQMKEYKNYTTKQAIQDLNSNNIDKTTKAILALFFKAGKPDQARRLKYSRGMVKMFNDRKKNEKR